MTIRRTFEVVTGAYLVVAVALGAVTGYLFFNQRHLEESQRARLDGYLLADELRQSSDMLTRFARLFVATGAERYRKDYGDMLALHNNEATRPVNYARLYWDMLAGKPATPQLVSRADLLHRLMTRLNVGPAEFALLDRSEASSDSVVSIEQAAIRAASGDSTARPAGPNRARATELLNDSTYNRLKTKVMQPLDEFVSRVEARATGAVTRYQARADLCFRLGGGLIALLLALTIVSLETYRRRISAPVARLQDQTRGVARDIDRLADATRAVAEGDLSGSFTTGTPRLNPQAQDEVSDLARLHDSMITRLADTGGSIARLTAELHDRNQKLAELNDQKNEFLGMAAHDLRNPLAVFLGFTELLLKGHVGRLDAEQERVVGMLHRDSEFMLGLVNDLLDVARIESGKVNLDLRPVDLGALAEENVGLNRLLAEKNGVKLALRCPAGLPTLTLDRPKIWQVFNNLISNAVKFSRPGTETTVELARVPAGVTVAVRDQGVGIPAAEMASLFKPFCPGTAEPAGGEPCSGLGLTIVKRIVESHGGKITVESQVGAGSTFTVFLPNSVRPEPQPDRAGPTAA
jgi:signal transduction histidine kinase